MQAGARQGGGGGLGHLGAGAGAEARAGAHPRRGRQGGRSRLAPACPTDAHVQGEEDRRAALWRLRPPGQPQAVVASHPHPPGRGAPV